LTGNAPYSLVSGDCCLLWLTVTAVTSLDACLTIIWDHMSYMPHFYIILGWNGCFTLRHWGMQVERDMLEQATDSLAGCSPFSHQSL